MTMAMPLRVKILNRVWEKRYAVVTPVLGDYEPDLVIVSAGFDAHEDDPLAQMRLTTPGYRAVAAKLRYAARQAGCRAQRPRTS